MASRPGAVREAETTMWLFHYTTLEHLPSIYRHGLLPSYGMPDESLNALDSETKGWMSRLRDLVWLTDQRDSRYARLWMKTGDLKTGDLKTGDLKTGDLKMARVMVWVPDNHPRVKKWDDYAEEVGLPKWLYEWQSRSMVRRDTRHWWVVIGPIPKRYLDTYRDVGQRRIYEVLSTDPWEVRFVSR